MDEPEVLTRIEGGLGRITLNRPKALNALTTGMVRAIDAALTEWERDDHVHVLLIEGAGERGLCAGGDIRMIYETAKAGDREPALTFWREEYALNARLAAYNKPIVALMTGLVMGGGVGISAHVRHRIVTESTKLAMPEVGIGFVPDVGGTWLLSRAPGELGTHVALTGAPVGPADVLALGLADWFVPSERLVEVVAALQGAGDIGGLIGGFRATPSSPSRFEAQREWIDAAYKADAVEAILAALEARSEEAARTTAEQIRQKSPTSLKVTLRALRAARILPRLEDCLAMEFKAASACLGSPDMQEGIRAAVVDKDRNPKWSPARLEDVTPAMVDRYVKDGFGNSASS